MISFRRSSIRALTLVTVLNAKILELAGWLFPITIDFFDVRTEKTLLDILQQAADLVFCTFTHHFDAVVRNIFDPAYETDLKREPLGRIAKSHTLHPSAEKNMRAAIDCRLIF